MLNELDTNTNNMSEPTKHRLSIHRSNLFRPKPFSVKQISRSPDGDLIAVIKHFTNADHDLSLLEIHRIRPTTAIKLLTTFIEHERFTGVSWISNRLLITTSLEQTINIYGLDSGKKEASLITDYGAITSMKYSYSRHILVTGTEYGYVIVYNIIPTGKVIEVLNKMVKITGKITSLDFMIFKKKRRSRRKTSRPVETPNESTKRKRADSDEESEPDADPAQPASQTTDHLIDSKVIIYGACDNNVVCWDYREKRILETLRIGDESCKALSVLALENGDLIVGDSTGTASFFDYETLTCRQNINIFQSGILCIAKNDLDSTLVVAGQDAALHLLKRDKNGKEFVSYDKIETHTLDINSLLVVNTKEYIAGSVEGQLTRFFVKHKNSTHLSRVTNIHSYTKNIKFSNSEMMIQYDNSLVIWKLPKSPPESDATSSDAEPIKSLLIKTKAFIYSSTFNDDWICYSTKKTVNLFHRLGDKLVPYKPSKALTCCNMLELCLDSSFLATASGRLLNLINLKDASNGKCMVKTSLTTKLKPQQMLYIKSSRTLVVSCGPIPSMIYTIQFKDDTSAPQNFGSKLDLKSNDITFLASGEYCSDKASIYAYTMQDKILHLTSFSEDSDIVSVARKQARVSGLPKETNILGMVLISDDTCILYDECQMFKVDMKTNTVVNTIARYRHIVAMNNSVFENATEMAVVELTPEDYWASMPLPTKARKKFGQ